MSSTPRVRVVGLAAGLALTALAGGYFLLSSGQSSSSAATHSVIPLSQRKARSHKPAVKHRAVRPVRRKPVLMKKAPQPASSVYGLPPALSEALSQYSVVVLSLYAPKIELDDMATREARAGAVAANVGFVALDVLNEGQSKPLTKLFGVLEDPAVLVFRRPNRLVVRFSGFVDQQTVEQAARNAGL